jgi:hypothetical protein
LSLEEASVEATEAEATFGMKQALFGLKHGALIASGLMEEI